MVVVVVCVVRERERKGERNNDNMGFFANIPKPPKLAGFFGDEEEEENASDGTNDDAEGEKKKKEGKIAMMKKSEARWKIWSWKTRKTRVRRKKKWTFRRRVANRNC